MLLGIEEGVKQVKRAKLAEILRRDYVKTIIIIVVILVSVAAFWYGLRFALGTYHPLLAVASGSMEPTLQIGDLILVQGVQDACEIHAAPKNDNPPGDIIVFRKPGNLIVHRAVNKTNEDGSCSFKTQGDANPNPDGWTVRESDIIGKVVGRVPLLGHIALFFEPFEVKVAFIVLWITFLILLEVIPMMRKKAEESQDETKPL